MKSRTKVSTGRTRWGRIGLLSLGLTLGVTALSARADDPPSREPVPTAARQATTRRHLEEVLELSKATTSNQKRAVLRKVMALVDEPNVPPDELYVLLQTALPLVREAGDVASLRIVLDKLAKSFDVDADAERGRHLLEFLAATKSRTSFDGAVRDVVDLAEAAGERHDYVEARRMIDLADDYAGALGAKASRALLEKARGSLGEREAAYAVYKRAERTLADSPDDPAANFDAGFWKAAYEGDWPAALPVLAKGQRPEWRAAAVAESREIQEADTPLTIADAWWEAGQASEGKARSASLGHALDWYERVLPETLSPLLKARAAKRHAELAAQLKRPVMVAKTPPATERGSAPSSAEHARRLPVDDTVDLLAVVKVEDHVIAGDWRRSGKELIGEAGNFSRFFTPIAVKGGYRVSFRFTRRNNVEAVYLTLPVGETCCNVVVDGLQGKLSGLECVGRRQLRELVGTKACFSSDSPLSPLGRPHRLEVDVLPDGEQVTIHARIDGKEFLDWKGDAKSLLSSAPGGLPHLRGVGVVAYQSPITVHELSIRLEKDAVGYWLDQDWKTPLETVADAPPPDVIPQCHQWNGRYYYLSKIDLDLIDAQILARNLKGRLVTPSTAEENEFVRRLGNNNRVWLSGWCSPTRLWRDERNRPLRYIGAWMAEQPDNFNSIDGGQQFLQFHTRPGIGWADTHPRETGYACIEWGEEYPPESPK